MDAGYLKWCLRRTGSDVTPVTASIPLSLRFLSSEPRREKNLHALAYQLRRRLAALEPGRSGARLARAGAG